MCACVRVCVCVCVCTCVNTFCLSQLFQGLYNYLHSRNIQTLHTAQQPPPCSQALVQSFMHEQGYSTDQSMSKRISKTMKSQVSTVSPRNGFTDANRAPILIAKERDVLPGLVCQSGEHHLKQVPSCRVFI